MFPFGGDRQRINGNNDFSKLSKLWLDYARFKTMLDFMLNDDFWPILCLKNDIMLGLVTLDGRRDRRHVPDSYDLMETRL